MIKLIKKYRNENKMTKYCLITTTCNNVKMANKITDMLLENKLVSCVQVINIKNSYLWNGKIEKSCEILLQMKTKRSLYKEIEALILSLHNDETPQILAYDIVDGFYEYLNWIESETKN